MSAVRRKRCVDKKKPQNCEYFNIFPHHTCEFFNIFPYLTLSKFRNYELIPQNCGEADLLCIREFSFFYDLEMKKNDVKWENFTFFCQS